VYINELERVIISSPGQRPWELMPWCSFHHPSVQHQLFLLKNHWTNFNQTW